MGTRHVTVVKEGGETKVAQYGQWDGYPTGQGQDIADFLKTVDLPKFKKQVHALKRYTPAMVRKAMKDAGWDGKSEWVDSKISDKKNQAHPALDRDYGAGILKLIHDGTVKKVQLVEGWEKGEWRDDIWIEYWYTIDLDKETVSMNGGKEYSFTSWKRKGLMEKLENPNDE